MRGGKWCIPAVGAASGGGQGWSGAARALNGLEAVHRRRHFAPRPHLAPLVDPKMHNLSYSLLILLKSNLGKLTFNIHTFL